MSFARVTKNGPAPTGQFAYRCADAGKVAARTIETRNQPWATGSPPVREFVGLAAPAIMMRRRAPSRSPPSAPVILAVSEAVFNGDIPFLETQLTEAAPECGH